ncbi:MAG: DEAD/DEAH box helicase, partial [Methyloversatilis sp.]|nr:DEAD/DEAH box helicase [Methyloversatilis sp.]
GFQSLEKWVERLRGMRGVAPVAEPEGFGITLLPYQRDGLAWLQHLRAHDLGGILADDMGLGKTAQALAHLLTEKLAGRLDRPALVVLPTSLVFNWQREAERFAPQLSVLKLHGADRSALFNQIPQHDVCLTTYPLLWRDHEKLAAHDYHLLILDEAQTVKNTGSQAAKAVRLLRARHRLCLTGTPMENHLGELWAQFDFLLPGFLGESKDFTRSWRTPIEKHGDLIRRELLARRVAPFILRRRKDDVAKELPPKTEVLRTVELTGRQRDLYETVRVAMDKRVREEIASRGFARSRIVILDALLKLRQVCCDPRLLKTDAALRVKERAKLDLLMDMLENLLAEGRKVLVFSQFTAMLDLIKTELDDAGIGSVMLTGDTTHREAVVRRFQEGTVPVFLISLKAGGVGLNLTNADTVIHYDPWWNPAAENQASDRAHRIGQDKPVFVYKLIVAGSIEERIVALQEKKAALAEGILGNDEAALEKFGETDLAALFEPLAE